MKDKTFLPFDPFLGAKLEVDWWKIHDELEENPDKTRLVDAFTQLYATIYGVDEKEMRKAARYKALATLEHDLAESTKTPKDEVAKHWNNAKKLLTLFYSELKTVTS